MPIGSREEAEEDRSVVLRSFSLPLRPLSLSPFRWRRPSEEVVVVVDEVFGGPVELESG